MPLLKKDIEQLRLNTGESNNGKEKDEREKTNGEILADIHKIKRFLFYETRAKKFENHNEEAKFLMSQMAYLSKKALKEGFDEQKRDEDFDGGPILGKIQSYLEENFATSDLPSIIKPSRGIILVNKIFNAIKSVGEKLFCPFLKTFARSRMAVSGPVIWAFHQNT